MLHNAIESSEQDLPTLKIFCCSILCVVVVRAADLLWIVIESKALRLVGLSADVVIYNIFLSDKKSWQYQCILYVYDQPFLHVIYSISY